MVNLRSTFRLIYSKIPLKKHVFLLVKKFWKPKDEIYKHLHFTSAFKVDISKKTSFKIHNGTYIENEIFWNGLFGKWEKQSMSLWVSLSKSSNTILDIGANNGIYALVAKSINWFGPL